VLLLVASALLIGRQVAVRAEMRRLSAAPMAREIELRLTELVRRSADVIAVVNGEGTLSFVSPAAAAAAGAADGLAINRITHRVRLLGGALCFETPSSGDVQLLIDVPMAEGPASTASHDQLKIHDHYARENQQRAGGESQVDAVSE